ncbi:cytidine deaminase [Acerihabitans arboris]|uniref:Cytidine deaminase n=1 Tax=Acerihabitans arboris TaxID=2691583 RepID=A0A845SPI1_9GAMM|nr:cytidine deaminase [Acerihabitans arboris]NDL65999.1 cytidine deaminase [Acerihabitans arboris]
MHARFNPSLDALEPGLRAALAHELDQEDFSGWFSAAQAATLMRAGNLDENALCFALLPLAAACALAPVSRFNVGAVARGVSGNLYFGANMEFIGAPLQQTVHAEQSAINHAWLRGEKRLRGITVNYTPCGHCRQFMNELNSGADLMIYLPDRSPAPLAHYLPDAFGPRDLAIHTLLMDGVDHQYAIMTSDARGAKPGKSPGARSATLAGAIPATTQPMATAPDKGAAAGNDPLARQALLAANQSHAPYSQAHSGVALQTADGRIFAGRYAENAAFNPSLPPLQSALILVNMAGADCGKIHRAALAEREGAPFSQADATRSTLRALDCGELTRYWLT